MFRIAFGLICLAAAVVPFTRNGENAAPANFPGWPMEWDGRALVQIPLNESEQAWTLTFPGMMAKFSDGQRELLLRWITRGSRQLHSSSDCFRGLGFRIKPQPALRDPQGRRWGCSSAERNGRRLRFRERILDEQGHEWTDVSAWFWSVTLKKTTGPWWAITVVETEHDA